MTLKAANYFSDRAHEIYTTQLQKDGTPRHKLASLTAEAVDMPPRTIRGGNKRQLDFTLIFCLEYDILYTIARRTF